MSSRWWIRASVVLVVMSLSSDWASGLEVGRYFSDHMVLQREKPVKVWGSANAGAEITVAFADQSKTAVAGQDGQWSVALDPLPANAKAGTLTVASQGKSVVLKDVLVGDVILIALQTSIDLSLGRDEAGKKAAAEYKKSPLFRAISVKTIPASKPQNDLAAEATAGWNEVGGDAALTMSATAFYLGRDLKDDVDVPVGIVDLNLGKAFPLSWLSREALEETAKFYGKSDVEGQLSSHDKLLESESTGVPLPKSKVVVSNVVDRVLFPSGGYNAVLHPLKGLALKAALVQLGNDYPYALYARLEQDGAQFDRTRLNTCYVDTYDILKNGFRMEPVTTPRIPREWRKTLGDDTLPVGLIVPPGSDLNTLGQHNREMRELQRVTAEGLPGVGVIQPGSESIRFSAQPLDASLLAKRCVNWLAGAVYKKPGVPSTGPLFDRLEPNFNEATIHFKAGTAEGLKASGRALEFFEAAGVEGEYSPVKAVIDGNAIRIASETLPRIVHVRYNWNHRPDQGLVNAAGLPAVPFRSERADYVWFVRNEDNDLPVEYFTPANAWEKNDVTLVNGQLETFGYNNFTGWLGPVGVRTGPFGPNMGVRAVKAGSPADGKLLEGDVIYSVNGTMLGDKAWEVMADAITASETREGRGKLLLGVRRGSANIDVEITLAVLGSYSATSPYDCPKTEKIIKDLEAWLISKGADAGFLNTDALFLLATGEPELQGYVRRVVYGMLQGRDLAGPIDTAKAGKSWHNSAEAMLLGEYYLATGDRNVLPYLKHACDRLAVTQNKEYGGWRHNFPGGDGYGLIPNAGLPGVMGMYFAIQAGLDIDKDAYARGLKHYRTNRAETGYLIYGYGLLQRDVPPPIDPEALRTGNLHSANGGLSAAGILMRFSGEYRAAHLCSFISAYAWNTTFGGHGGNFWNNFWTPLGARDHSRAAFINFWKNHRWYREMNRMYDGSLIEHESAAVGAGTGIALVAPRERLQIVGAPPSPFAANAPEILKSAVSAYWNKEYADCEKQVVALISSGTVGKNDLPTAEYLLRAAREIQTSIAVDLARVRTLVDAENPAEAKTFLAGLKGIIPTGNTQFAALESELASVKPAPKPQKSLDGEPKVKPRTWERLVSEIPGDGGKYDGSAIVNTPKANVWKFNVLEDMSQAPEGWMQPAFDDSGWKETSLPISWRMYHTALLRTTFTVKDKDAYDGLRFFAWMFRQQAVEIYLNGELVGKVNNLEEKTGNVEAEFKESVLKHLKNGANTLAITTRHNWRWGMLSMMVYNGGFDFNLDARLKP